MKFSYNWLKELVEFKESPEELSNLINTHITEVETTSNSDSGYNGVIVAEILEINNHPNADKLHLVVLDVGLGRKVTVVCGANNIAIGQKVPLALVGAKLPGGEMKAAVIRGVESTGMICSGAELGLEKKSDGILVLDKKASVGRPVQEYLEVPSDTIIDLKVLSNRPDHLSYIGIAREIAAVLGKDFSDQAKSWSYKPDPSIKTAAYVQVEMPDPKICPKYLTRYVSHIEVKESPDWLQNKLISSGVRPINNIVDISNFVMLELGQPVHAFDANKLTKVSLLRHPGIVQDRILDSGVASGAPQNDEKAQIVVRRAKSGETMLALDGKNYALNPEVAVIADGSGPIALAGLMGSEPSGVTDLTTEIIIEVATFDPVTIRRGSKSIGLATDASMRFERGLQPPLADIAMTRVLNLITQIIPEAKIADGNAEYAAKFTPPPPIICAVDKLNQLLGSHITAKDIGQIMTRLFFDVKSNGKTLTITPPVWRHDIKELADIAEEIVRIWGIDKIVPVLPVAQMVAPAVNQKLIKINELKDFLVQCGFSEAPSHSFIGEEWGSKVGIKLDERLKIANPLNQQWTHLIDQLWPNLLEFAAKSQAKELKFFDIATVFSLLTSRYSGLADRHSGEPRPGQVTPESYHNQSIRSWASQDDETRNTSSVQDDAVRHKHDNEGLPIETTTLAMLVVSKQDAYRILRGVVELLSRDISKLKFVSLSSGQNNAYVNSLHIVADKEAIGIMAEINPQLADTLDVPVGTVFAEIDIGKFVSLTQSAIKYQEISRFPASQFDVSVALDDKISAGILIDEIKLSSILIQSVEVIDVYELPGGGRSITLRVVLQSDAHTLADAEIKAVAAKVNNIITTKYRGHIR
ncbi:TPA: phenylalanine--tRNA ligase subunit beta [Patescibacteria group bacterium]|nr:phenylalanine--tRNA ligase subunit beta [Patescibacteria group bacterium]